jgi:hypothetical protein
LLNPIEIYSGFFSCYFCWYSLRALLQIHGQIDM